MSDVPVSHPASQRLQRLRRIPWLEISAGLLAPVLGVWLGRQLASDNWTSWVTLIGVAFHVVVALANPLAGLLLYTITAPYARFVYLDIDLGGGIPDLGLNRVVAGTLVLIFLANLASRRWRLRRLGALEFTFLLFAGAMFVSATASVFGTINAVQTTFDAYVIPFFFLFAARHLVRREETMRWVIGTFLVVGVYLAFITVREQWTGEILFDIGYSYPMYSAHIRKVVGLLGIPTFMGMSLAIIAPVALYALVRARTLAARGLLAFILGFVLIGVFNTYARAGWLGTALALLVMGLLDRRTRGVLIPLGLAAAVFAVISWNSIITSYAVTERLTAENSLDFRFTAWQISARIIRESPILGIGFNSFGYVAQYRWGWTPFIIPGISAATHNTLLFIFTSAGFLGFLPYGALCFVILYSVWRQYRRARAQPTINDPGIFALGIAVFMAYMAPSLTVDMPFGFFVNTLFFLFTGAVLGLAPDEEAHDGHA
ncbi:MAG: O-antigen ligase family protein [Anaerolineae bacterium]|nr:O-antigen ligase family protein [Anaerolineae bacterium]